MTAQTLAQCHACPHLSARNPKRQAAHQSNPGAPRVDDQLTNTSLGERMRQMHDGIEAEVNALDSALRRTLLCLGGILLPFAGLIIYTMARIG